MPLRTGFLALFFVARHKQGISALQFQRDAGLGSDETAWMLLHKGRSTLAHNPLFPREGDVEVDETSIRLEETTLFTDAWGSSKALAQLGIDHRPRKGGHGRQALDLLPWAHTVSGNLKTWLRGSVHGVSPKHLQRYLDEFVFRFHRRWCETELFLRVLHRALDAAPCTYRQLTAERIG